MNVFELTRALVDIDSVTPNEEQVGVLPGRASCAARRPDQGRVERIEVEPHRYNVLAHLGPARRDALHPHGYRPAALRFAAKTSEWIWGRGACDTKGIIASMIFAVEALLAEGRARHRAAVCGRRGAQQRGRAGGGEGQPREPLHHQWRADGKQARAGIERRAAV